MIQFLSPWAAAGLVLLAGPLLVHLLLRRNARHVLFPAARFLVETRAAAVRVRRPSDVLLLIVRLAIVAAAVAAAAQPLLTTSRRLAQWDGRTVRAVVVDTTATGGSDVDRLVEQEMASAFRAARFASADLSDAIGRSAEWFGEAPPGRREVVIVSDFQRGAIDREDLDALPAGAGVRTIRTGSLPAVREVRLPPVEGYRDAAWQPALRLDASGTAATWTRAAAPARVSWLTTSQAERENEAAARAVHAAISAGVASGDDTHRIRVRFAGGPAEPAGQPVRTRWMVDAALALRRSPLLRQIHASVSTAERDGQLVVETSAAAASLDAPAIVRAIVLAVRPAPIANREAEVVAIPDAELSAWRRDAAPLGTPSGRLTVKDDGESDARWFWAAALTLLAIEGWLRARTRQSAMERVRDAA